jgi:hypothetical protein
VGEHRFGGKGHKRVVLRRSCCQMNNEVELLRQKVKEVEIDSWIEKIKLFTPRTSMIPLDYATGVALLRYFDEHRKKSKISMLTDAHKQMIATLCQRVDEMLAAEYQNQAFVKFSFRSPKDATVHSQATTDRVLEITKPNSPWMKSCGFDQIDNNVLLAALLQSSIDTMLVRNSQEVLNLLVQSDRAYEDLHFQVENKQTYEISLVIREWGNMQLHHEFRCFVYQKHISAVSQYTYPCYYPNLAAEMVNLICSFVSK